jgi:hypothetical protein
MKYFQEKEIDFESKKITEETIGSTLIAVWIQPPDTLQGLSSGLRIAAPSCAKVGH